MVNLESRKGNEEAEAGSANGFLNGTCWGGRSEKRLNFQFLLSCFSKFSFSVVRFG